MATWTSTRATAVEPRRRRRGLTPVLLLVLWAALLGCEPPHGTIGAMLGQREDGRVFLREVPPDLAAGRAGLQEGDELLLIEGRDVRQMSEADIHQALGGPVGESVRLTLVRNGEILRVTLARTPARRR